MELYIPTWFLIIWLCFMFIGVLVNIIAFKTSADKASKAVTETLMMSITNAVEKENSKQLDKKEKKCKSTQKPESALQKSQKK